MGLYRDPSKPGLEPYIYRSLPQHSIRVVVLQPSESYFDPIACDIDTIAILQPDQLQEDAANDLETAFMNTAVGISPRLQRMQELENAMYSRSAIGSNTQDLGDEWRRTASEYFEQERDLEGRMESEDESSDYYRALSYCWGDTSK